MKAGGGPKKSRSRKAAARKRSVAPKAARATKAARAAPAAKTKSPANAEAERLARELADARERHSATAEVLSLIADAPTDLQPVFDRIVRNAARLCQSVLSAVYRRDGDEVDLVAHDKFSPSRSRRCGRPTLPRLPART